MGFNSLMVRLKATYSINNKIINASFNSLMVRLKERRHQMLLMKQIRFNSLMVRLKEDKKNPADRQGCEFQFLDGAIKSFY